MKRQNRILHILPLFEPAQGGPSLAVIGIAIEQRKHGLSPWILACGNATADKTLVRLARKHQIPVIVFPYCWRRGEYAISPRMAAWLWCAIPKYRLLYLHYVFTFSTTTAGLFAHLRRTAFILRPAGQLGVPERRMGHLKKKWHFLLVERHLLRLAQAIHTTSPKEAAEITTLYAKSRTIIIPHGVPLAAEQTDADKAHHLRANFARSGPPHLVSISRLDEKKRIIELLSQCASVRSPLTITIAGGGPPSYQSAVTKQAALLGHPVKIVGELPRKAVWKLLSRASLFICMSVSENFSLSLFEALYVGVPCIISSGHHYARLLQHHGAAIVVDDINHLGERLSTLLEQRTYLEAVGRAGRTFCKTFFSWEKTGELLANLTRDHQNVAL